MKKYLFSLVSCFLLIVVGTLLSCKSSSVPLQESTEKNKTVTITETLHDTVFKIEKDDSYYQAYLECVNGKVVVTKPTTIPSLKGALQVPKVNIVDNKLSVDCEAKAQELFAKWKSQNKTEATEVIRKIPVPVPRELSFLEKLQIGLARCFLVLILIYFVNRYFKPKI